VGILALSPARPKYWHFTVTNNFGGVHGTTPDFDRYFPVPKKPAPLKRLDLSDKQLERFTGTYRDLGIPAIPLLTARLSISI